MKAGKAPGQDSVLPSVLKCSAADLSKDIVWFLWMIVRKCRTSYMENNKYYTCTDETKKSQVWMTYAFTFWVMESIWKMFAGPF